MWGSQWLLRHSSTGRWGRERLRFSGLADDSIEVPHGFWLPSSQVLTGECWFRVPNGKVYLHRGNFSAIHIGGRAAPTDWEVKLTPLADGWYARTQGSLYHLLVSWGRWLLI